MKPFEGTISELKTLWKPKTFVRCPRCGQEIEPGLHNISKHWVECPNSTFMQTVQKQYEELKFQYQDLLSHYKEACFERDRYLTALIEKDKKLKKIENELKSK